MASVSVESDGPPLVSRNGISKIWYEKIVACTTTNRITGLRSGSVTRQKVCHRLAPSTAAASMTSSGTFCSPAKKYSELIPRYVQMPTRTMASSATRSSRSQLNVGNPSEESAWFKSPNSLLKTRLNISAITTNEVMNGKKKVIR